MRLVCLTAACVPVAGGRGEAKLPGVAVTGAPGVPVAGVAVEGAPGVAVGADPTGVAVGADPTGVAVGVGAGGGTTRSFVTVAVQRTRAPPPFAEPLHWSTFTGSVVVVLDPPVTEQTKPTLVPPLPEPLHWPTVAAATEVTPGVLAGVQVPGAPVPVISEPTHW